MNDCYGQFVKVAVTLLAAALAACATGPGGGATGSTASPSASDCTPDKKCLVKVYVDDCKTPGRIRVVPNELVTPPPGTDKNHKITWEIQTEHYVFINGGIKFYAPDGEFSEDAATGGKYTLTFKNSKPSPGRYGYNYGVEVGEKGGVACAVLDPFIRNNN